MSGWYWYQVDKKGRHGPGAHWTLHRYLSDRSTSRCGLVLFYGAVPITQTPKGELRRCRNCDRYK